MNRGFTLLELLVVLAIAAAMTALAAPSLGRLFAANLDGEARRVVAALRDARSIALDRGNAVVISADDLRVDPRIELRVEPDSGIRFAADGISSGGRVALRGDGGVRDIVVDWPSGRVRRVD